MAVEQSRHRFQLGAWIATSTIGWTVGLALGSATTYTITITFHENFGFQLWWLGVSGAMAGASVGIMQWLILRRQLSRAGWWIWASIVGGAVGFSLTGWFPLNPTVGFGLIGLVGRLGDVTVGAMLGIQIGAPLGIMQWFVLRQRFFRAGWWLLANIVGFASGFAAASVINDVVISLFFGIGTALSPSPTPITAFIAAAVGGGGLGSVVGLAIGAITGMMLAWLWRRTARAQTG